MQRMVRVDHSDLSDYPVKDFGITESSDEVVATAILARLLLRTTLRRDPARDPCS